MLIYSCRENSILPEALEEDVKEAPKQNENCVFPFQYNGQSYSNCTNIDFGVVFWCSTEANATDDNWGVCEDSCPKEPIGNSDSIIT